MVVVVTRLLFVAGRRSSRLDAPQDALFDQHAEGVVYRLARDGADLGPDDSSHIVCRAVGATGHRSQYGQTLGRDLDTVLAKKIRALMPPVDISGVDRRLLGHNPYLCTYFRLCQESDRH